MTHCFNKPEFISWQARLFEKFMLDDCEYIVFNDAPNATLEKLTAEACLDVEVRCVRVPQEIHCSHRNPSAECSETIQYMMESLGFDHDDVVVIIDSDMFLTRDFSFKNHLGNNDVSAHLQCRQGNHELVTYFLPNLMIFNMPQIEDRRELHFAPAEIDGAATDSGGLTHYYIKKHPTLKWLKTDCYVTIDENTLVSSELVDVLRKTPKFYSLILERKFHFEFYNNFTFTHFHAGSNWPQWSKEFVDNKTKLFFDALDEILTTSL